MNRARYETCLLWTVPAMKGPLSKGTTMKGALLDVGHCVWSVPLRDSRELLPRSPHSLSREQCRRADPFASIRGTLRQSKNFLSQSHFQFPFPFLNLNLNLNFRNLKTTTEKDSYSSSQFTIRKMEISTESWDEWKIRWAINRNCIFSWKLSRVEDTGNSLDSLLLEWRETSGRENYEHIFNFSKSNLIFIHTEYWNMKWEK